VAHVIRAERTLSADGLSVRYDVHGPLFFGSSNDLVERFAYGDDPKRVAIDLTHSQIWDASTVAALDSIETKYRDRGATVVFSGPDQRNSANRQGLDQGLIRRRIAPRYSPGSAER
jgi:SulP family sulfate permease